jgi:hypothetical protein
MVKTMQLRVTRVRKAKATVLKKQLKAMKFLVSQLGVLSVKISEPDIIHKFLSVVPKKFSQMACSIETLLNLDTLSVDELISWLKAAEERYELEEPKDKHADKLLLSEEE